MRWERLIEELGAVVEQDERDARDAEIADRIRREVSSIVLVDRLREAEGDTIVVRVEPDRDHRGELRQVGSDWLLLAEPPGECLIATSHVRRIDGLGRRTAAQLSAPAHTVFRGMDLRYALRGIAADRAPVRVGLVGGGDVSGTIDRVGKDFIDLALHAVGELRRAQAVRGTACVPLSSIAEVVRQPV